MAHASVAFPGSEALFHNPSLLSLEQHLSVIISCESRFMLKELSLMTAGLVWPSPFGTFGGSYRQFGTGVYREELFGICYTKKLGKQFSAAIGFDYLSERLPENSKSFTALTVEGGISAGRPGKALIGMHVFNPVMAALELPEGKELLPWSVRLGSAWFLTEWLIFCSELDLIKGEPVILRTGIEFRPHPEFCLRAGVSGGPLRISAGAGLKMGQIELIIAFSHHGYLGYTPIAGISFVP